MEIEQLSLRCPVSNSPVSKEFENVKHSDILQINPEVSNALLMRSVLVANCWCVFCDPL
jgi:hypothetical protein